MKKVKGMKINNIDLNVNVIKTVTIGAIKVEAQFYCVIGVRAMDWIREGSVVAKKGDWWIDVGDWEVVNIKYSGLVIDTHNNIEKFVKFHQEIGIDIHLELSKAFKGDAQHAFVDEVMSLTGIDKKSLS